MTLNAGGYCFAVVSLLQFVSKLRIGDAANLVR